MTVVSFFLGATAASALTNNTPIVAVLIPVVRRLARAMGLAPTLLLIPLSYAVILGGTCTLIGTSTNLLVDGVARAAGLRAFSIFEITPVGLVAAATVLSTVLLLARWLLPSRASAAELADQQGLALDMTELTVHPRAPVEGKSVGSVRALTRPGIEVVAVERDGCIAPSEPGSHLLAAGDRIIVRATMPEVLTLHTDPDFGTLSTIDTNAASKRTIIVEAVLAPSVFGTPRQGIVDIGLQRFRNRLVVPCLRAYCAAGQNCPSDALSIARPTRPPTGH